MGISPKYQVRGVDRVGGGVLPRWTSATKVAVLLPGSFRPHDDRLSHRIESFDDPELLNHDECTFTPPPSDRSFSSAISTHSPLKTPSSRPPRSALRMPSSSPRAASSVS